MRTTINMDDGILKKASELTVVRGEDALKALLKEGKVACHPYIMGELACGDLTNRTKIIGLLKALPQATVAEHEELMRFVDIHRLLGVGLGYIDVQLLASARLTDAPLWTMDTKLRWAAEFRLPFAEAVL
jgi:predicted nucleic acid-binding protein